MYTTYFFNNSIFKFFLLDDQFNNIDINDIFTRYVLSGYLFLS